MKFEKFEQASTICLYGYGLEGKSSEKFLKQKFPHLKIQVYEDDKKIKGKEKEGASQDAKLEWDNYDIIVRSPGILPSNIPQKFHPKITSNISIFLENLPEAKRKKVIGITGSKGKSTTVKFCHEFLQNAGIKTPIAGNYGIPFLEVFDDFVNDKYEFIVAECSSFQLDDLKTSPGIAFLLSLFKDHLDWHGSYDNYVGAKRHLWEFQKEGDMVFAPEALEQIFEKSVQLTKSPPLEYFSEDSILRADHFRRNLGTVWAFGEHLKIENQLSVWKKTVQNFEMIEHRLELFIEKSGIKFYNDSIATSPNSVQAAVQFFSGNLGTLIVGGQDTGVGNFDLLVELLKEFAPQAQVVAIESDISKKFNKSAKKYNYQHFILVDDLESAVDQCFILTPKGMSCVFSPGGKSFDCFKNYSRRGRVFKALVENK